MLIKKEKVNKSKKWQSVINLYNKSFNPSLFWVYNNPSLKKQYYEEQIKNEMLSCGGWGYTILTYNTSVFTCAYLMKVNEITYLIYHTPSSKYMLELED